jgi:RNA polymerase sigma-70 factor (ECF subfamily)
VQPETPGAERAIDVAEASRAEFRALFRREASYVWHSLRRLGVPSADLEDLTHEVFLQVYRQLDEYDRNRPMRPWLFAFVFRKASEHRRRARVRFEVITGGGEQVDPAPSVLDRALEQENLDLGYRALDELDLAQRAVFVMHDLDGVAIPEIASMLGIPLNTAYSRLRLARTAFDRAVRRLRAKRGEP